LTSHDVTYGISGLLFCQFLRKRAPREGVKLRNPSLDYADIEKLLV